MYDADWIYKNFIVWLKLHSKRSFLVLNHARNGRYIFLKTQLIPFKIFISHISVL